MVASILEAFVGVPGFGEVAEEVVGVDFVAQFGGGGRGRVRVVGCRSPPDGLRCSSLEKWKWRGGLNKRVDRERYGERTGHLYLTTGLGDVLEDRN